MSRAILQTFVILASGTGTNAQAMACHPELSRRLTAVISDRKNSGVLEWAQSAGVTHHHVSLKGLSRAAADTALLETIRAYRPSLIVLAGFMRILGPDFIGTYTNRIVNIHPSLLPKYPGINAIERSWHVGDEKLGVTVHLVDQGVDTGPVLAQASIPRNIFADLTEAKAGIHELEHALYPAVVSQLLSATDESGTKVPGLSFETITNALPSFARLERAASGPEQQGED